MLGLLVVLAPLIASVANRLRVSGGRPWFLAGYVAVIVSQTFSVLEDVFLHDSLYVLQHVALAVSGALFLKASWETRATVLRQPEPRK